MKKNLLFLLALFGGFSAFGQYCSATYNSQCTSGDYIDGVVFNTISNTGSGCSNPGTSNYSDYLTMSTNLLQGSTYPITVSPGPTWGQYFVAFIDFNNDNDFADAGEFFDIGYVAGGASSTFNIAIPTAIPGGVTRLRVMCRYSTGALTQADVCASGLSFGEIEDYTVVIPSPLTDDAGISAFVTPTLPTCNFSDSVRVELTNYGTDTLTSALIYLSLPSGTTSFPWTGSLPSFGTAIVNLGAPTLTAGMSLMAYTQLPNGVVESPLGSWNDTSVIANLSSGLNGTYTIGGTAPDYADISSAISALNTFGICGPVVFDIRDGSYNEQFILPSLASSSATNTVTFRSENADPSLVTITFAGTSTSDNYVVRFANTDHFIMENLTLSNTGSSFGRVVDFTGGSDNNRIEGCILNTNNTTTTSNNMAVLNSVNGIDNDNVFKSNTFKGGSYGAYWYGSSTTSSEVGNVFEGNNFEDNYYAGTFLYYNNAVTVKNNLVFGNSAYNFRYGIYLYYCNLGPVVTGNNVYGNATSGFVYGLYMSQSGGNNANRSLVANNMVQAGKSGSTSTLYGLYFTGSGYIDCYHNTVLTTTGATSSRAMYATGGGEIAVKNNIFANYTAGYAVYAGNAFTMSNSDYNVMYSPAGKIGYFNGDQLTMADWQTASAFDANSIDYNPNFFSDFDLHVCNDSIGNQGTVLANITMDIDGHARNATNPDMGADEFNGIVGSFLGNDIELCAGDSVQLIAGSPTDTILWSNGATTSSIWVSSPGSYSVTVNSACGVGSDAVVVTASALNYAGYMAASDVVFCNGDSVLLTSTQMADTYAWSDGSTSDSLWVTTGGTYTLTITDGCGTGTEGLTITMNDVPTSSYTATSSFLTGIFSNTSVSGGNTTYAWDFGDGTTSSLMNPSHVFTTSGAHIVTLTVTNDCGSATFVDTIVLSVIGLEEIADFGSINVYPNPSTGLFTVDLELNETMDIQLVVTNVMGQVVSTKEINAANGASAQQIDLSNEAAGVYYMSILSNENELINKMLIKK